jgi:hypothetical protein
MSATHAALPLLCESFAYMLLLLLLLFFPAALLQIIRTATTGNPDL